MRCTAPQPKHMYHAPTRPTSRRRRPTPSPPQPHPPPTQILGNDANHLGACGVPLVGDDAHALIAASTKYLSSKQGFWEPEPGACGRCACVRLHGADTGYNTGPNLENVRKYTGLTFAARVGDR
jgi:hypothetical protein